MCRPRTPTHVDRNLPVVEVELPIEIGNHAETCRSFEAETFGLNDHAQGTMTGGSSVLSAFVDASQSFFVGSRPGRADRQEGEFHLIGIRQSSETGRARYTSRTW